ncbi:MAG: hypothetical protein JWM56_615 [Candidatus Peribacteria bacterium]|nr:hypothetical protein [Candidatus Peribacteria bacterium]
MCAGLALPLEKFDEKTIARHRLEERTLVHSDGTREVRFLFRSPKALLPVLTDGSLDIYEWGNRDNKESRLPHTGWCRVESLSSGKWNFLHPEAVVIPAASGVEKGVWFEVPGQGIQAVKVYDEEKQPHVYMLTQPATEKYRTLTRHDREPVFTGKPI